jgi:hypothetical protein
MGLTSAEGQKLECFKSTANNISISNVKSSKPINAYSHASISFHPGPP